MALPRFRVRLAATFAVVALEASFSRATAARVVDVGILDKDILMVHVVDGEVTHTDNGKGPAAFTSDHFLNQDTVKRYNPPLDTTAAMSAQSWSVSSSTHKAYASGLRPVAVYRKSKVNGHAEREWGSNDFEYEYTREHFVYLRLPVSLEHGGIYTLTVSPATACDVASRQFVFDIFRSRSEAVHVNLVGYLSQSPAKKADLYHWMGSGGPRDYSSFAKNRVYLVDVNSGKELPAGTVAFWKPEGEDVGWFNLTRSSVWAADFDSFAAPGVYRLAVEGVGCSPEFSIDGAVYFEPFRVSVKGFFYMRIGQDSVGGIRPVPRRPLYIPGVSPANTVVYLTTMHPWHAQWKSFSKGDVWDQPNDWARFKVEGSRTNRRAHGGHSDALDWDRHPGHIAIIYDMLLPFVLTNGAIDNDDLGIAESGNGVPDILDEARTEVDFWLRLRDGAGYGSGLTNPNSANELFQAAPTAWAAWANAANAAMLADCYRIAGATALMEEYRDSASAAYDYASGLTEQMPDQTFACGETFLRGRDLKLLAAVYMYNVTGDTVYELAISKESVCAGPAPVLDDYGEGNSRNQVWATAGYLTSRRTIHYPQLWSAMKACMIAEAKRREADFAASRPSRRACDVQCGYFRASHYVDRTLVAHATTTNASEKEELLKALTQEADWGLGRNPLNMIQMTTATTALASKRSVTDAYTTGRNDGTPGVHPGHTPFFNLDDWACGMTMGCPSALHTRSFPGDFKNAWPIDEGYFPTRYVWAHNEFTPQQTMRGKMALYGYLYGIGAKKGSFSPMPPPTDTPGRMARGALWLTGPRLHAAVPGIYRIRVFDIGGRVVWRGRRTVGGGGLDLVGAGAPMSMAAVRVDWPGGAASLSVVAPVK